MPCYKPLTAFQTKSGAVVFRNGNDVVRWLTLPCGQCIGCRLERSRQWAVRCLHESQLHSRNCAITLTYDDQHLPDRGSLRYSDFQLFMKRCRKRLGPFRFFMCGEYGETTFRPHYHALFFGMDFPDMRFLKKTAAGSDLYTSETLDSLWDAGFASIGQLNFESAAYVARYVTKKVTGKAADDHYRRTDLETGECYWLEPEFLRMSLKPGIGSGFFFKYGEDVYPRDYVVVNGSKAKPPRYYDKLLEAVDSERFEDVKLARQNNNDPFHPDSHSDRLRVREICTRARLSFKKRSLE